MTPLDAALRESSRPDAAFRLTLARIIFTPLCASVIAFIVVRDMLAAALGADWLPRLQLHLQFNSLCFLVVFLPCVFVLYALYRQTAFANWILTAAGLGHRAARGRGVRASGIVPMVSRPRAANRAAAVVASRSGKSLTPARRVA
jgi:hypothetical protein